MGRTWITSHRTAQQLRLLGGAVALATAALGATACSSDAHDKSAVAAQAASDQVATAASQSTTAVQSTTAASASSDAKAPTDDGSTPVAAKRPQPHYVVFPGGVPAAGWKRVEAVRLTGAGGKAQRELDAALDWFAEYLGPGTSLASKPHLSVSGYAESLADFRKHHPVDEDVTVKSGKLLGRPAIWGADASIGSRFVVIALTDDYAIELKAGGMKLAELRAYAATLKETTKAGWKKAGGVVVDCVPEDPCPGVDPS